MDVLAFISTRPCLEEIDGYLFGLKYQLEHPDIFPNPQYTEISGDVLGPLHKLKADLMSGKTTPAPTKLERAYIYRKGAKPKPAQKKGAKPKPAQKKVLDLNRR